ncbi:MAG: hypothetical protein L6Q77_02465 [Bacteroidetes bacterium]|nr:hypothetical protein [Bacteroidota bacterium]
MKNVFIIAPFWGIKSHVGSERINKLVSWFRELNCNVTVVSSVSQQKNIGITLLCIKNPFTRVKKNNNEYITDSSGKNNITRKINEQVKNILIPDPTIVWSLKASIKLIFNLKNTENEIIISSSPPESVHIVGLLIGLFHNKIKTICDFRDGWIDEPLKGYLHTNSIKSKIEKLLIKQIETRAKKIILNTDNLLFDALLRNPKIENKTYVITNGYPIEYERKSIQISSHEINGIININYCGRISKSIPNRNEYDIIKIITSFRQNNEFKIIFNFAGDYTMREIENINKENYGNIEINFFEPLYELDYINFLGKADGFILLSPSLNSIPIKTFDYLFTGKPILALTNTNSEVSKLKNIYNGIVYYDSTPSSVFSFVDKCKCKNINPKPIQFTNTFLQNKLLAIMERI